MNSKTWAYLSWAIKNIVAMICWTIIAITFNRWWLMLFAILFLSDLTNKKYHTRFICDCCGEELPFEGSYSEAVIEKRKAGWTRKRRGEAWLDICKNCSRIEGKPVFDKQHVPAYGKRPSCSMKDELEYASSAKN